MNLKNTPPVVALEIGPVSTTVIVGELLDDGNITITGRVEQQHGHLEPGQAPTQTVMKRALDAAEEEGKLSIYVVHLIMACENIRNLVAAGTIPVLTSSSDAEVRRQVALLEGITFSVADIVFSGYCAALAVTKPEQRANGTVVLDLGHGMATCAAFAAGKLAAVEACRMKRHADPEAIQSLFKSIKQAHLVDKIGSGILLTGQDALTPGLSTTVETVFTMPCTAGYPIGFKGLDTAISQPDYAACLGMIRYAYTDGLSRIPRSSSLTSRLMKLFSPRRS
jgi:cell division ATPase FtsA